jgi:hypothetical protein
VTFVANIPDVPKRRTKASAKELLSSPLYKSANLTWKMHLVNFARAKKQEIIF